MVKIAYDNIRTFSNRSIYKYVKWLREKKTFQKKMFMIENVVVVVVYNIHLCTLLLYTLKCKDKL